MEDSGLPQWMKDIMDVGTATFNKFADLELFEKQLEIAREVQFFSQAQAAETDRAAALVNGGFGFSTMTILLLVAGVGVVALIATR